MKKKVSKKVKERYEFLAENNGLTVWAGVWMALTSCPSEDEPYAKAVLVDELTEKHPKEYLVQWTQEGLQGIDLEYDDGSKQIVWSPPSIISAL